MVKRATFLPLATIVSLVLPFHFSVAADVEANKDFLRHLMHATSIQLTEPIVKHCLGAAPGVTAALDAGYANYRSVMEATQESWIQNIKDSELASTLTLEEEREISEKMNEVSAKLLESVRQRDANTYCPWLAQRLTDYTPEAAWQSLEKGQAMIKAALDKQR